ncbi:uncharacterized protein LOC100373451 [Saccoglossus kowalevskii]|uniref:Uncharacterized protein LOC100373451 n=1 Tax=Saccoglossus kowalevskii TaxID=10224 RepID=A0ABM0H137_SACKO|nr:PREDICTED: uncharacterized protein LOC100373451 [Saccoglossus kowalevskii]
MPARSVTHLEDQIRTQLLSKRVRVTEFFKDYDRLRSGYMTISQFKRVLDQSFGIQLGPEDEQCLLDKYADKNDGTVNYRYFSEVIEASFQPNDLKTNPMAKTVEPAPYLGTQRSVRLLSPTTQSQCDAILHRMIPFYKYHGINIRTCYEDFDRHHNGLVTESQFYRSFPGPPDVTEQEMRILASKYLDPSKASLCNYLNFHNDVEALKSQMVEDFEYQTSPPSTGYNIPGKTAEPRSLEDVFDKIRVAVYKNGIRTTEFFRDHDKLRSYIITENQFICGLSLAVGKEAQLSRSDIQKVVDFYKIPDGRVRYKEFCDLMENAFNEPGLEKNPTLDVQRPAKGALSRYLNPLNDEEEARVAVILQEMSETCQKRRLMMYAYFKDYDRSKAYTRNITFAQFGRILHFLSLHVQSEDFKLLCRKFEDPERRGDVNYPAFVQAVDREFVGFTIDSNDAPKLAERPKTPINMKPVDISKISIPELTGKIRHHVLVNRIRVNEYFQDFDQLRTGSISQTRFRMGLSAMGLSAIGQLNLTDSDFLALAYHYSDPNKPGNVLWQDFMVEIETVFTQVKPNLEKTPTVQVPSPESFMVSKPGTLDWRRVTDEENQLVEAVMDRMRQRAMQRRVLAKPCFQDFDRHNRGYVTGSQFRQCLTYLSLSATEQEAAVLQKKYFDQAGFNYLRFLEDLQPSEKPEMKYQTRLKELELVNNRVFSLEKNSCTDLDAVLTKIKSQVMKKRIRILEFLRDYDKLRTGRMKKETFRRALDPANLGLKGSEVSILENAFESQRDPGYVEYLLFNDEIESIFTIKNLEKDPLVTPKQFSVPIEIDQNVLTDVEEPVYNKTMEKLSEKVRMRRMQLFPLFEDYDRVHNGTVSRSQFRRVLTELELSSMVNEREFQILYKKYDVKIGDKDDVNYIAFCDNIYELAHFEWRKP